MPFRATKCTPSILALDCLKVQCPRLTLFTSDVLGQALSLGGLDLLVPHDCRRFEADCFAIRLGLDLTIPGSAVE